MIFPKNTFHFEVDNPWKHLNCKFRKMYFKLTEA